jgi:twinkle protein
MDFSDQKKEEMRQWALTKSIGHHRRTCPECSAQRKNKTTECLSVEVTSETCVWQCWHCEARGAIRLEKPKAIFSNRIAAPPQKKEFHSIEQVIPLDAVGIMFAKQRGLSQRTCEAYGLVTVRAYFRDIGRHDHAIGMPYFDRAKQYGYKARSTAAKLHCCQPALKTLFGIQLVDMEQSSDLVITEGEWDAMACFEAGILNAVSVPNGASSFTTKEEGPTMGFLWSAKEQIDKARRVIVATDADEPGDKLADELARRVGKHRCWRLIYPEDCKDANDILLKHGAAKLKECIDNAEPWPVEGLYEANDFYEKAIKLYTEGFGERIKTGLEPVDKIYSVGKGLLTVITGVPGNGKSTFVDYLMLQLARSGTVCGVCSFENPPQVHIGKLAEMILEKHFFETELPGTRMTLDEFNNVMPFIHQHFKFLQQDDGEKASLDSIIERVKTAVFRWGIRVAVIDPYNYIARPKNIDSETAWIDDMLTRMRLLAASHDLHIWFIAHPTKLQMDSEGKYQPPKGYSISGSASWYSKPDFGLTVHKDGPGGVRIINWKTRFHWTGQEGEAKLLFDNTRHTYLTDAVSDMHRPMVMPNGQWVRAVYGSDDE